MVFCAVVSPLFGEVKIFEHKKYVKIKISDTC
jgi:hypothetical protein